MRCAWYFIPVLVLSLTPQGIFAQADNKNAVLEKIFADWKERQGLVKTARYVVTGSIEYKDKNLPPGNPVRPLRIVLLLDIEHKRWRLESSQDDISENGGKGRTYVTMVATGAFNGTAMQHYLHRDLNKLSPGGPDLSIAKGQLHRGGSVASGHLYPVFFAHGVVDTANDSRLRPDDLPMTYDAEDFEARGGISFHGRNCTVLRTMPSPAMEPLYTELWIDTSRKSAIYRHVNFAGTNPWTRTDVDWKQTDLGWWPHQWTLTWSMNKQVWRIERLRVESFEPNPPVSDPDFTLEAKPGMRVEVADSPPPGPGLNPDLVPIKTYVVSPSGSWQEVSAKGYTTLEGIVLPPESNGAWVWWGIGAVTALVASAFMYFLWRRRKAATMGPNEG